MKAALIYKDYHDFFAISTLQDLGYFFDYNEELLQESDLCGTSMSKDQYGL